MHEIARWDVWLLNNVIMYVLSVFGKSYQQLKQAEKFMFIVCNVVSSFFFVP